MSLDFAECPKCDGYIIEGTLKLTGITLSSRCRCEDTDWDRENEARARERAAEPLPGFELTECHGDPFLDSMKRRVRV